MFYRPFFYLQTSSFYPAHLSNFDFQFYTMDFSHLHVHSQFSLLDGAAEIGRMFDKVKANDMPALAITDHGNMFGVFKFVNEANKKGIKPIVGCEFYVVEDRHKKNFTKESGDQRFHQLLLAKNQAGYVNLSKLCSLGYIEGLYSKWPRIDKELIEKYHEGLIATTCCLGAEVPRAIIDKGVEEAEKIFQWYLNLFGEDYYIELQRHALPEQDVVNRVLLDFAKKYQVKVIATNDSHYINQEDWVAHDILLCINTGDRRSTPIGEGKGFRFGFPNDQFYLKTKEEMAALFSDVPEALSNTLEIVDKIEPPKLKRDILLPNFPLPPGFNDANEYLRFIAFDGAKKRYKEITAEVEERINHELKVITDMGFAGYFLIVSDFIKAGRDLGVLVGPGRGSAAGSVVAFAIGITNIDPIKYSLLFERFLNPERVSMPDIDTDFDDKGRQKVIDYVVEKYGKNKVAQIITYGSMAAKSSIKDVARALDLPLQEANELSKMVPERAGITLRQAYDENADLKSIRDSKTPRGETLQTAEILEGSVRNTGVHAAGVIIAPDDLMNFIPLTVAKDSSLWVTQFDGKVIEDAGMLKMDFLGLKTLTIIGDAIKLIKKNYGIDIDPDEIPLDDPKTLELYQRGDTVGTFQFESDGMRKYLRDLKPTHIEDLIAMNALYRPGPMDYIDSFIRRKHGKEIIEYPHELLEPILRASNGIMVYQEQIMQTAQIIAGYSLGGADLLRRAMGKKDKEKMAKERIKFVEGAGRIHGITEDKANEIFSIMEKFAEYGFNRSHSAAYSVVAFQTGYLKANYPGEYMSAVLNNHSTIEDISYFMDECQKMNIPVLGPDINESNREFTVNKKGEIRFGMGALKGVGEAAVDAMVEEREKNGSFTGIFDLVRRVNLRVVNKRSLESLVLGGALDSFANVHRAQYFHGDGNEIFLERAIKFGVAAQEAVNSAQVSLFGDLQEVSLPEPVIPAAPPWGNLDLLKKEKEVIGMYISGHPLDNYKFEMKNFCTGSISQVKLPEAKEKRKEFFVAGIIANVQLRTTKKGDPMATFHLEDFDDSLPITFFSKDYMQFKPFLQDNLFVAIKGKWDIKFKGSEELEFKITKMNLLSELKDTMAKELIVKMSLELLSGELVNRLFVEFNESQGSIPYRICVGSKTEQMIVDMQSKRKGIALTDRLIDFLVNEKAIQYDLALKN